MSNRKSLANALYLIAQPLLLNIISIPATAYIIRSLGPLGYGQWMIAVSLVTVFGLMSNLGLRTIFIRTLAQDPEDLAAVVAEQLGIRTLLAALAGAAAVGICIALGYDATVRVCVLVVSLSFVLTAVGRVLGDVLQAWERFRAFSCINLLSGLVLTAASVLVIWRDSGPIGLSVAYATGPVVTLITSYVVVRRRIPIRMHWSVRRYWELLYDARALAGQSILAAIQQRMEQLLVPKLVGVQAFGVFAAGTMPSEKLIIIPDGLTAARFPGLARTWKQKPEKFAEQARQLMIISVAICLPIAIMIAFIARPVAVFLFRTRAAECEMVIQTTIWTISLMAFGHPICCALEASGRYTELSKNMMRSTLASMLLSGLLVPWLGLTGACLSLVARYVLALCFIVPLYVRSFPGVFTGGPFLRIAFCGAVMAMILVAGRSSLSSGALLPLLAGMLAIAAYAGAAIALRLDRYVISRAEPT